MIKNSQAKDNSTGTKENTTKKNAKKKSAGNAKNAEKKQKAKDKKSMHQSMKMRQAVIKEMCSNITQQLIEELTEDASLCLSGHYSVESDNVKRRVMRRIVEKRQAQMTHRLIGRSKDGFSRHLNQRCASRSMDTIHSHLLACA